MAHYIPLYTHSKLGDIPNGRYHHSSSHAGVFGQEGEGHVRIAYSCSTEVLLGLTTFGRLWPPTSCRFFGEINIQINQSLLVTIIVGSITNFLFSFWGITIDGFTIYLTDFQRLWFRPSNQLPPNYTTTSPNHWWVRGPVTVWQPIRGVDRISRTGLYGNPPRDRSRIEFATILRYFDGGFTVFSPFCILFLGLGTMVRSNARNVAAELNACTRPWKACKARVGSFRSCQQLWNRIYIIYIYIIISIMFIIIYI